jgi:hypothetical protein
MDETGVHRECSWRLLSSSRFLPGFILDLHAGKQHVRNLSAYDFFDAKVGMTKAWENWSFAAAAICNNGDASKNNTPSGLF